jgi:hypothetical protein
VQFFCIAQPLSACSLSAIMVVYREAESLETCRGVLDPDAFVLLTTGLENDHVDTNYVVVERLLAKLVWQLSGFESRHLSKSGNRRHLQLLLAQKYM